LGSVAGQTSGVSQPPVDSRHTTPACVLSAGQKSPPLHTSGWSQTPVAARQVVSAPALTSGHVSSTPLQTSATSQGACSGPSGTLSPLARQTVPGGFTAFSVGQMKVSPSQTSGASQRPPVAARQTVPCGAACVLSQNPRVGFVGAFRGVHLSTVQGLLSLQLLAGCVMSQAFALGGGMI
jgi:hypothetical protein